MNSSTPPPWQCFNLRDVAEMLGVSLPTVKRMVKQGIIPVIRIAGIPLVTPEALSNSPPAKQRQAEFDREEKRRQAELDEQTAKEDASLRELAAQVETALCASECSTKP